MALLETCKPLLEIFVLAHHVRFQNSSLNKVWVETGYEIGELVKRKKKNKNVLQVFSS